MEFIGHLVIEKLLKAYYVRTVDINHPFIHDLLRIAQKTDLRLTKVQEDFLDVVTTFNLGTRYSDYKMTGETPVPPTDSLKKSFLISVIFILSL